MAQCPPLGGLAVLTRVGRRLSYVIPLCVIVWISWLGDLSWWAAGLLAGGFTFAMDWLWNVPDPLDPQACFLITSVGLLCLMAAFYLASGLNQSLGEYWQLAAQSPRSRHWRLHFLPVVGLGLAFYGLLSWIRAWLLQRNEHP